MLLYILLQIIYKMNITDHIHTAAILLSRHTQGGKGIIANIG